MNSIINKLKIKPMNKAVGVHLAHGFEEIEAITIIDVLRRAEINVLVISVTGNRQVEGAHQIKLMADTLFDSVNYKKEIEMIVLPGGMPGSKNLCRHEGLNAVIHAFDELQKPLGAICAAPLVFGELGILVGKRVVCYPGFEHHLTGAEIKNEAICKDGHLFTGQGVGAALYFALMIVKHFKGEEIAYKLQKGMLVD